MEKWEVLYKTSILKQQKWFTSNHNLKEGDNVQILDIKAAQSLCLVISKEQCEGSEPAINDSIACISEDDMPIKNAKNKVKVKFQQDVDQIINSLS